MLHSNPASSSEPNLTRPEVSAPDRAGAFDRSAMPSASRLVALSVVAGLVVGVVSWLIGETVVTVFRPPYHAQHVMGQTIMRAAFKDQSAADTKNATVAFALLGGLLGAALGMAGGLARKSTRAGLESSVVGLVLGVVLGTAASLALLPVYYIALERGQEELSRDLTLPLFVLGGIWAACGLAGGVALGIGLGVERTRVIKAALGGLIGAVVGAVLYEMIGAMAFPTDKITYPLATTWAARLLARLLVASLSALIAAVVINMQGRRPSTPKQTLLSHPLD
jgi:hypothetical protein